MPDKPKRTKLERLSAGALLLAQEKTEKGLNAAIAKAVTEASAAADSARRTAPLLGIVQAGRTLAQDATRALLDGRQDARAQASRRLRVEASAVGVALPDGVDHRRHFSHEEDDANAQSAGGALAAAWTGLALALFYAARRKEASIPKALKRSVLGMKPKVERTAATECARAYGSEHSGIVDAVLEQEPKLLGGLGEVWSAILDTRVCPTCAGHDGEVVPVGDSFKDGDEPGEVHPLCRCVPILVNLADYKTLAA